MIAVIFEVVPHPAQMQDYLEAAALLRPRLEALDGFVSVERFESLSQPGKLLSLSFWRDEEAVRSFRNADLHRKVQSEARERVFEDYRLRVAAVVRDYGWASAARPRPIRAWRTAEGQPVRPGVRRTRSPRASAGSPR